MLVDKGDPRLGLLLFRSTFISNTVCGYETRRGPLILPEVDMNVFGTFVATLKDLMKKESALYFYWEPPFHLNLRPHLLNQSFLSIPTATFVVDLSLPLESLWTKLDKRARWSVKKARKMEVTVSEAKSWENWATYHSMYAYESHRKHIRPRSLSLHKAIYKYLLPKGMAKLFLAKLQGKVIAGSLFLLTSHEMVYYESTSVSRYNRLNPSSAIQWHAISWAKDHNLKHYDLGGTISEPSAKHFLYGVHKFKRQWGGRLHKYNCYALNKLYVAGRNLALKNPRLQQLYYTLERSKVIKRFDRI